MKPSLFGFMFPAHLILASAAKCCCFAVLGTRPTMCLPVCSHLQAHRWTADRRLGSRRREGTTPSAGGSGDSMASAAGPARWQT
jgi:hypothetical protein